MMPIGFYLPDNLGLVSELVRPQLPRLIQVRRHLHQYPELSNNEVQTANYIEQQLQDLSIRTIQRLDATSLVAVVGPEAKEAIAVRADIDALAISEQCVHEYQSRCAGLMHACGHDVHATILIGLAAVLSQANLLLSKPVKLIFQQAEESYPSGAPRVIARGALDYPKVKEIYGFHVWPELDIGKIGVRSGPLMGSLDGLVVRITMSAPSSSHKKENTDAIRVVASFLESVKHLYGMLSEEHPATISFGIINGGTAPNHFASEVTLEGTLRALTRETREDALAKLNEAAHHTASKTGSHITMDLKEGIRPLLSNSTDCIDRICQSTRFVPGCTVEVLTQPLPFSEDFGWYLELVPGAYVLLGSKGNPNSAYPLHSPFFDVDERVIEVGVSLLSYVALSHSTEL